MGKSWGLRTISSVGLFFAIVLLLSGCPKRADLGDMGAGSDSTAMQSEEVVKRSKSIQEPPVTGAPSAQQPATAGKESPLKDIFFDFDKSTIRDDVKSSLNENLQWLNANPTAQITIEGHCDERGTAEYNLGLGERRAKAVKDYFMAAGINAKRIRTVSFGKERPFATGHNESAWKWNRRAHFVVDER